MTHPIKSSPSNSQRHAETWPKVPLGNISAFITKGATPTTYGFAWESSGIPFLRSECVSDHGLDMRQAMNISPAAHHALRRSQVTDGDILMTITGYVGRVIRLSSIGHANINQHIARVRVTDSQFDHSFVYHYLSQGAIREHYEKITTGQAYPQISLKQVRETEIPAPPLEEQRAISTALDDMDAQISTLQNRLTKAGAVKQGLLQQLLTGRSRLPGFQGRWKTRVLGDLLLRPPRYGIAAAAVENSTDTYSYIRITDINNDGRFEPHPRVGVRHANSSNYLVQEGEILFARTGASVGKSYLYDPLDGELVYAGFLINIKPDPDTLDPRYLDLYARTESYWNWVEKTSMRSGQPGINGREYMQLEIPLPEIEEQHAISDKMQSIIAEMDILRARIEKARSVKQGMMQQLLTGRTRLPV